MPKPSFFHLRSLLVSPLSNGKNGLFFESQTVNSLASAIKKFNRLSQVSADSKIAPQKASQKNQTSHSSLLSPLEISKTAEKFSNQHFKEQLEKYLLQNIVVTKAPNNQDSY